MEKKIFACDFDGTLYSDSHTISSEDLVTLEKLGNIGVTRVIATGRNLYSIINKIPSNFPIDYLVFSSGAGIMEWKTKKIITSISLDRKQISDVLSVLLNKELDFMLHKTVPDNHFFYSRKATGETENRASSDFEERKSFYRDFDLGWSREGESLKEGSQFVIIVPSGNLPHSEVFISLKEEFSFCENLKIIRSTSPIDKKSMWVEIFQKGVSKALGLKTIADLNGISYSKVGAVGNDFNDLDMLRWAGASYVVENSPPELTRDFKVVKSNNESGVSHAVELWLENRG